jgi:DMSO reductase family type II enzyme chaperone
MPPQPSTQNLKPSELASSRAFIHRWLAAAYTYPDAESWNWLWQPQTQLALNIAVAAVGAASPPRLSFPAATVRGGDAAPTDLESIQSAYRAAFGHTVRGDCPPHEIEYGELKADPLFQPHRLADIAAFYKAFGMEIAPDAKDRPDFIAAEFEFMAVLCAKECYALENNLPAEQLALCRDAQRDFLRDHLARWTPAFTRRVERLTASHYLRALAVFTREFILSECKRAGAPSGNEDLNLRPADVAGETMCDSCGVADANFPGAIAEKV